LRRGFPLALSPSLTSLRYFPRSKTTSLDILNEIVWVEKYP
jgi:hypothetical protein